MSEKQVQGMFEEPEDYPIHDALLNMDKIQLVKRKKLGGQWKYNTKHLSEKSFDRIVLDVARDAKNPPVWLYHNYECQDLKAVILEEGLKPTKRRKKYYESGSYVCDIIDNHLPLRKNSVYFYTEDPGIKKYCPKIPWVKVRADKIPCRCKEINHALTQAIYLHIDNKSFDFSQETLKELGVEIYPYQEKMWKPIEKRYWSVIKRKNRELVKEMRAGKKIKSSLRLGYAMWMKSFKDFDGKNERYNEIMCPCKIPPSLLKRACEHHKGKLRYQRGKTI